MGALTGIRGQVYTDRLFDASGTITTNATAQLVLPVAKIRSSLIIRNNSAVAMYVEFGAARASASLTSGAVSSCAVTNAGFGYSLPPSVTFLGGALGSPGNPQIAPSYTLAGLPDWTAPSHPAQAHCVMTGAVGSQTVNSIVIDDPGSGYAYPPYVLLINHPNDPYGCAVPSATSGLLLAASGGSYVADSSICTTDQISIVCATSTSAFTCKFSI